MAQVTSYTDTDAIRGSIGVDKEDCPDNLIVDSNLELEIEVDLQGWLPTHETIFSEGNASAATLTQKLYKNYLVLYAQWFGAYEMASRFLLIPQIVSDGKNQMNRFANVELEKVKAEAAARMAKYRGLLDSAINGGEVSAAPVLLVSTPGFDPVTNT